MRKSRLILPLSPVVIALLASRNEAFHASGQSSYGIQRAHNAKKSPLPYLHPKRNCGWTTPLRSASDDSNDANSSSSGVSSKNELEFQEHSLDWETIVRQAKLFREMAFPFFQESKSGRNLFLGVIVLTLLNSGVSVAFSYLGKDFWNALSSKNVDEFYSVLGRYVPALLVGAPVVTYYSFQREQLTIAWREWMTDRTLQLYSTNRVYYALERGMEVDNPDQRIAEDVRTFTTYSLSLFLSISRSIIDLVNFSIILWSIYPSLFGAIVGYAIFGTVVTSWLGKPLVGLNYRQLQKEADFRYSLVRLRENSESIAFYSGEDLEGKAIQDRFTKVIDNARGLNIAQRNLEYFTNGYRYIIQILPVSVVAPKYFAGQIELGQISQAVGAFNHILSDLSIIINQFEVLSSFSAGIDRLSQFYKAIQQADPERDATSALLKLANSSKVGEEEGGNGVVADQNKAAVDEQLVTEVGVEVLDKTYGTIEIKNIPALNGDTATNVDILSLHSFDLCTPDRKRVLIEGLTFSLVEGTNLLIVGNSGAGKSSLLRGIAGLWTAGNGCITRPDDSEVYFLPQRPYCSLGSLKDQLLYPSLEELEDPKEFPEGHIMSRSHLLKQKLTDDDLLEVLEQVDLKEVATRAGNGDPYEGLKMELDWSNTLSLGEQQRLAFGRVLVNKPRLVILDEATSALDMVAEARMYTLLQNMARKTTASGGGLSLPGLTYISVGHRPSLLAFHDKRLRLGGDGDHEFMDIGQSVRKLPTEISNL